MAFSVIINCKFTVESDYERILISFNIIWWSCSQESWLSLCAVGTVLLIERWRTCQKSWVRQETAVVITVGTSIFTWLRQLLIIKLHGVDHYFDLQTITLSETVTAWTLMCEIVLPRSLFLCGSCIQSVMLWLLSKYLLVSKVNNAHIVRRVFSRLQFSVDKSCMAV